MFLKANSAKFLLSLLTLGSVTTVTSAVLAANIPQNSKILDQAQIKLASPTTQGQRQLSPSIEKINLRTPSSNKADNGNCNGSCGSKSLGQREREINQLRQ